jgi:TDG/mug DNA glycosylase family protein
MDFSVFAYKEDAEVEKATATSTNAEMESLPPSSSSIAKKYSNVSKSNITDQTLTISSGAGLRELYKSPCQDREEILRVIIIGHNPSNQSWTKRHYYANPVNRMWSLLGKKAKIIPSHFTSQNDQDCPASARVGFTDLLFGVSETNSCKITEIEVRGYKKSLYDRLVAHVQRVAESCSIPVADAYPRVLAFAGVRQWKALFPANHPINSAATNSGRKRKQTESPDVQIKEVESCKSHQQSILKYTNIVVVDDEGTQNNDKIVKDTIEFGIQSVRPPDWPVELTKSKVFLLPSSSGAAALTNERREQPYIDLGILVRTLDPLPQPPPLNDGSGRDVEGDYIEEVSVDSFQPKGGPMIEIIEIDSD